MDQRISNAYIAVITVLYFKYFTMIDILTMNMLPPLTLYKNKER